MNPATQRLHYPSGRGQRFEGFNAPFAPWAVTDFSATCNMANYPAGQYVAQLYVDGQHLGDFPFRVSKDEVVSG